MNRTAFKRLPLLLGLAVLAACGSNPPPPEWKTNTQSALETYERTYLAGSAAADLSYARARAEAAHTGRADWVARVELARCATRAAALEFDACPAYAALQDGATPEEKSYAAFLSGDWQAVDAKTLPSQYGAVLKEGHAADLAKIADPLSRLIAAAVLFKRGDLPPTGIAAAIDTASEQGWRRPLLAWLGVARKRAEAAGDNDAVARLQRRIDLVGSSLGK